jgi:CheY-like chemotaxis protein
MDDILAGTKVLLLDDEAIVNLGTTDLLEQFGCNVVSCFTISEAYAAIEAISPELAVLDVNIDGRMCYELADRLHELAVPIVFLTGYASPALEGRWRDHPFCRKPCDPNDLRRLLITALRTRRDQFPQD